MPAAIRKRPVTNAMHFVVSSPRSGSTWLANTLNSHPEIFATENRLFGNFCEVWPDNSGRRSVRITGDAFAETLAGHFFHAGLGWSRKQFLDEFLRDYCGFIESFAIRHSGKSVVVDKVTPYLGTSGLVIQQIRTCFPQARIIQLVRDGRDVAVSGVFDWLQREPASSPRRAHFVDRVAGSRLTRFFDDDLLATWCRYWVEPAEAMRLAPPDLTVRYEAMFHDQAAELVRLFDLLGVDSDPALARRCAEAASFRAVTGRNPGEERALAKARKGVAGDWKNHFTRRDGELFHELAGAHLDRLGYETGHDWINHLPDELELKVE
jgi:Sulfotransferase family